MSREAISKNIFVLDFRYIFSRGGMDIFVKDTKMGG